MGYECFAMLGVKGQNAADSAYELVRVAKKIEHGEDHDEKVEDESGDIAQDSAQPFGQKTGFFLNALLDHGHHVGIGIQPRHVMSDPRPSFRHDWRMLFRNRMLHAT